MMVAEVGNKDGRGQALLLAGELLEMEAWSLVVSALRTRAERAAEPGRRGAAGYRRWVTVHGRRYVIREDRTKRW